MVEINSCIAIALKIEQAGAEGDVRLCTHTPTRDELSIGEYKFKRRAGTHM